MCVCACTHTCTCMRSAMGTGRWKLKAKIHVHRGLPIGFFPWAPQPHCLPLLWPPIVLNSVSPGDVGQQLLRLPSQIFLGLQELILMGKKIQLYSLVNWPTVLLKSHNVILKEHKKPMTVPALRPATPRMPMPWNPTDGPRVEASFRYWATTGL